MKSIILILVGAVMVYLAVTGKAQNSLKAVFG